MTDLDEFEKWYTENKWNTTNHTKELMQKTWQARGELDAVRIKELEAKLDKAKEALKWIDKVNAMDSEYVRVARQALEGLDK